VLQLKQAGYLTTSDVARTLGIGVTTLRRREGTLYPRAARIGGIRVYRQADVELLPTPTPGQDAVNGSRPETALVWRPAPRSRSRCPTRRSGVVDWAMQLHGGGVSQEFPLAFM
jgi:hypothetical protein